MYIHELEFLCGSLTDRHQVWQTDVSENKKDFGEKKNWIFFSLLCNFYQFSHIINGLSKTTLYIYIYIHHRKNSQFPWEKTFKYKSLFSRLCKLLFINYKTVSGNASYIKENWIDYKAEFSLSDNTRFISKYHLFSWFSLIIFELKG